MKVDSRTEIPSNGFLTSVDKWQGAFHRYNFAFRKRVELSVEGLQKQSATFMTFTIDYLPIT